MKYTLAVTLLLTTLGAVVAPSFADSKPEEQILQSLQIYFQAWNEPVADKRDALLKDCWADNAEYTDPGTHAKGRAALSIEIGKFLGNEQLKGFSIVQASNIDVHHRVFRFQGEMRDPDGNTVSPGMDYGEYDDQGRITKIVGFFARFRSHNKRHGLEKYDREDRLGGGYPPGVRWADQYCWSALRRCRYDA